MVNILARPVLTQVGLRAVGLRARSPRLCGLLDPRGQPARGRRRRPAAPPRAARDEPSLARYLGRLQRQASDGFMHVIESLPRETPLVQIVQTSKGQYFPPAGWSVRRWAERNFARRASQRAAAP
jgi:hypothetical protein